MKTAKTVKEPLVHLVKRDALPKWQSIGIRVAAIVAAMLVVGLVSYLVIGENPFAVYKYIFEGAFGTTRRMMVLLRDLALLLIISLAVTPAFKMRFWNIGAEGQALIAALMSVVLMNSLGGKLPDGVLIPLMLVSSLLAGAIWAVIPAVFKAVWNTNETLFTLMMNYIATQIVLYFIKVVAPTGSGILPPLPYGNLPTVAGDNFWISIIVAAVICVAMYVYLGYSKHGYELSVVGGSENTAKYIGINVKKVIIRSLVLSGLICGVVGFLLASGINHTVSAVSVGGMGFTAILVSWLAKFNPFTMVLTSFLVVFLENGTAQMMTRVGIGTDFFASVVTGIVFFFIIGCEFFVTYKVKLRGKKEVK